MSLNPFIYWAQKESTISIKVDVRNIKDGDIQFSPKTVDFSGHAKGHGGENKYEFHLDLFDEIDEKASNFVFHESHININLVKKEPSWWSRLICTPQKPHWLKIDFERWTTQEDEQPEEEKPRDVRNDYPGMYEEVQKAELGYKPENILKIYLKLYNLAMSIGFLYIVNVLLISYMKDGAGGFLKAYELTGTAMKILQGLQFLEIVHRVLKFTKGHWLEPFMQTTGRAFIIFVMIECEPRMQTKPLVFHLFMSWSLVEIVRYPYYLTQLMKKPIGLLTWLRYTVWMFLYPAGLLCEGVVILRNIPYFEETHKFEIAMPNEWNFSFSIPTFLKYYLFFLLAGGLYLMQHMLNARNKKFPPRNRTRRINYNVDGKDD